MLEDTKTETKDRSLREVGVAPESVESQSGCGGCGPCLVVVIFAPLILVAIPFLLIAGVLMAVFGGAGSPFFGARYGLLRGVGQRWF